MDSTSDAAAATAASGSAQTGPQFARSSDPLQLDRFVHAILVFVMGWFWFIMGQDVDVFSKSTSWSYMASLVTQRHLSMIFAGAFICNTILWNASVFWMRLMGAILLGLSHLLLALLFYVGNPNGTAFGPYLGYALLASAIVWKIAFDHARSRGRMATPGSP